ncbi:MAG: hypothetical protein AAFO29_07515 [Actinomycetota bacterium]
MSSTESKLMWVAIVLSLILVLTLGTLAVYSVIGQDDDESAEGDDEDTTNGDDGGADSGDEVPPASPDLIAAQIDPPLSVRCDRAPNTNQGYAVIIANLGENTVDYVVSIELTVDGAGPLVASTDVPALAPGERREVIVNTAGPGGRAISDCSIAAVQSNRRVLLANS